MADITIVDPGNVGLLQGLSAKNNRLVVRDLDVMYLFYRSTNVSQRTISFVRSADGGQTWSTETDIHSESGPVTQMNVWYDRWTPGNTTGNLVHIVFTRATGNPGFYYLSFDVISNSVATVSSRISSVGISLTNADKLDIVKDRAGVLWYVMGSIEGSGSFRLYTSTNDGVDWTAVISGSQFLDEGDTANILNCHQLCLLPGFTEPRPMLIAKQAGLEDRIILLEFNESLAPANFVLHNEIVTGLQSGDEDIQIMGCVQRDADFAVFCCYVKETFPETLRCVSIFGYNNFFDTLVYDPPSEPDIRGLQVYADWVNGLIVASFLTGNGGTNIYAGVYTTSVNSGFTWDDPPIQFTAGTGDYVGLHTPYCNFDNPGLFLMAWYDDNAEEFRTDDSNMFLNGLFTVRLLPDSGQEIVSCLTGNPDP